MDSTAHVPERSASNREFFWLLVKRDLKSRYAGASLGAIWNLVHPVAMILIYVAVFSSIFSKRGGDADASTYVIHLCAGMMVWLVFSETLGRSVTALTDHGSFLQKIRFPAALLHGSIAFNVFIIYAGGWFALIAGLWVVGRPIPITAGLSLALMAAAGASALGLGLALSGVHVFFRDVAQLITILLQVGFWLTPVVYHRSLVAGSVLGNWSRLLNLNPMAHFVALAQTAMGDPHAEPSRWALPFVLVFPVCCLIAGMWIFNRILPDARDAL